MTERVMEIDEVVTPAELDDQIMDEVLKTCGY